MSLAYFIELHPESPSIDTSVSGKAFAHVLDKLNEYLEAMQKPTFDEFLGQDLAEFEDLLGESLELPEGEESEARWFDPDAGLSIIDLVLKKLTVEVDFVPRSWQVLEDLKDYQRILLEAKRAGIQWHLAIDL